MNITCCYSEFLILLVLGNIVSNSAGYGQALCGLGFCWSWVWAVSRLRLLFSGPSSNCYIHMLYIDLELWRFVIEKIRVGFLFLELFRSQPTTFCFIGCAPWFLTSNPCNYGNWLLKYRNRYFSSYPTIITCIYPVT